MKFKSAKTVLMDRRTPKQKRIDRLMNLRMFDDGGSGDDGGDDGGEGGSDEGSDDGDDNDDVQAKIDAAVAAAIKKQDEIWEKKFKERMAKEKQKSSEAERLAAMSESEKVNARIKALEDENAAMRRGHYCEDAVAQWWAHETGRDIIQASAVDFMFVDREKDYLRVSPDRTFWLPNMARNDDNKGILECKTTNMKVDPDDLPKWWFCQLQMNLGVAGYSHGSIAWLGFGFEFGYMDIEFVPDFYNMLVEAVTKFWTVNVMQRIEPEPVNVKDFLSKYNKHVDGKVVEVSDEVLDAYHELKEVKREMSELDERKTALEDTLKMAFGDAEAIAYDGATLATWKAAKDSVKFDEKAFKAAHPDEWDKYAKTVQGSRRFLLK